jgi:gamma-glutamyltranspeptidase/glutathione hydrolase
MRRWHTLPVAWIALVVVGHTPSEVVAQSEVVAGSESTYEHGAVAADHPLGSEAGAEILRAGGNAAEAAAATMLALGVVSPASSGLGGGGFALYYRASDRSVHFIDFRERAPAAATADMFVARPGDDEATAASRSRVGGLAVAVPGEPAGIEELLARFSSGRVDRAQVYAPAIRYAEDGFETSRHFEEFSPTAFERLQHDPVFGRWFPGGQRPALGTRLTNPTHARTLRAMAQRAGAFYRGAIAREIVARVRSQGGIMTMQDLAAYRIAVRDPMQAEHFGYRWVSAPPPSAGGLTLFGSLALLERWVPPSRRSEDSALFRHALIESWRGPYTDRHHYLGDPDHVDVPIGALLGPQRIAAREGVFHPMLARPTERYDFPIAEVRAAIPGGDAGTSHFCVADAEGNIAAVTTTVNLGFGARFSAAGVAMNDEMDDFAREVGEPNAFGLIGGAPNLPGPGRRPVSSMSPTIVFSGDDPVLCVGGAGGSRIITAVEQVALFSLLFGDSPGEALARRRVHHQGTPDVVSAEEGLDEAMRASLVARGHRVNTIEHSAVVQVLRIEREGGRARIIAASDPRKHGAPAGH